MSLAISLLLAALLAVPTHGDDPRDKHYPHSLTYFMVRATA